jgi:hypothetical protein
MVVGARRAPALLLRTNLLSCSLSAVSTEAIEQVDVERRRLVLRAPNRASLADSA